MFQDDDDHQIPPQAVCIDAVIIVSCNTNKTVAHFGAALTVQYHLQDVHVSFSAPKG